MPAMHSLTDSTARKGQGQWEHRCTLKALASLDILSVPLSGPDHASVIRRAWYSIASHLSSIWS